MDIALDGANCREYIYSEDYLSFLIKYNGDLQGVYQWLSPECITIINSQFLVAYSSISLKGSNDLFRFGYNSIPKCFGLMDISVPAEVGAERVRNLPGLALTGKDVLMGFVDTGIDYRNNLFKKKDGTTRIAAIWDQNREVMGTGPAVFGYGAEYTSEDINEAIKASQPYSIVPSRDEDGHGTFLASVAAGGIDEDVPFSGIAPDCDIVMVKLKPAKQLLRDFYLVKDGAACYSEDDIILGVKYLINKAIELKKPIVICLGIGTNQGDHNGNANLELYLDTIANLRGVCVVVAAGNELGYRGHFSGDIPALYNGSALDMEISVGREDKGFTMEIWGNAPGLLKCSLLSPTGEVFDAIPSTKDGAARAYFIYEATEVYIENAVVEGSTGDQLIFMRFVSPAQGIWTVRVTEIVSSIGRGFDAWLPVHSFLNSDTGFVRSDPDVTLCIPGTGRGSITASGYNHNTGALYVESSRGYTRKGQIKPDIAAPAVNVFGVFATSGTNTLFTRKSGTSVASACVAGAACLLMEWGLVKGNSPGINTETIRQILIRGAAENYELEYPNPAWGWGTLDLYGSFEAMRNSFSS